MSIKDTTQYVLNVGIGKGPDIKGYFGAAGQGELIGKTIKDPNKEGPEYTIESLYANTGDQVVLKFKEGLVGTHSSIELTFNINNECINPVVVTVTDDTLGGYTGTDSTLFNLLEFNDSNTVYLKLL